MEAGVYSLRQRMRVQVDKIKRNWERFLNQLPFIITIFHVISWLSLVVLLLSLIFVEDSRTILVQFLWSFYVILQFWLLARSKTLPWKRYITFFLVGAWVIAPFTALVINLVHLIFGGETSDFWSSAILTPIAEEVFKLIPVIVFLFLSKRTSHLSLTDFMLMGAAAGAGFQFLEETARRLGSGLLYGQTIFGQQLHWDVFTLFPGYFEDGFFATITSASHVVITALISLGIGIAIRLRGHIRRYAYIIPALLSFLERLITLHGMVRVKCPIGLCRFMN